MSPGPLRAVALAAVAAGAAVAACGASSPGDRPDASADGKAPNETGADAMADAPPPPPLCTVASRGSSPTSSGLVISGRLLLPAGAVTGELFIASSGTIACAAASCASASGYGAAARIDCPGGVISPALIDAHDHTEYATVAPEAHGDIRYEHRNDWREGADGATPLPSPPSTTSAPVIAAQELRLVLGGATSIVGTGGVVGLARNLGEYTNAAELEGLTEKTVFFDTFPLGDQAGEVLTSGCGYPDIISAGEAFEDGVFAPHLSEGINLAAQNELLCAAASTNNLVTNRTSVIHGVGVNATDVHLIASAGASLIWAPRSNIGLYGDTAPVTEYRYAGVSIALGTDWLPSGSMNMLRELACASDFNAKYLNGTFSDQDLWAMATANAATNVGFSGELGTLAAGKVADVTVFDARARSDYAAVTGASVEDVHLVLRGGKPLYGDAPIVSALASGCAPIEVCTIARSVCLDVPGVTLDQVEAAASSIYPLFFCRGTTPTAEPSCIPYRDTYPNGTSATDRDGDGIPDGTDDCPDVFNPPRPMDDGKQSDIDGDGIGDACDPHPLGT